ncbi:hypothetical protein pb186bvf_010229 [Paramecium bursaria]
MFDSYKYKNESSEKKPYMLEIQQSQQKLTFQEMENKIVMLATENERLLNLLQDKQREIQFLTEEQQLMVHQSKTRSDDKFKILENKATKVIYENEKVILMNQSLTIQLDELRYQYDQLQQKFMQETEYLESKWRNHFQGIYETQLNQMSSNIQSLLQELKQSQDVIAQYEEQLNLKQKDQSLIREQVEIKDKKAQELLMTNQSLQSIVEKQEIQLKKAIDRNNILQNQVDQYNSQLKALQNQLNQYSKEIDDRKMNYEQLVIRLEEYRINENQSKQIEEKNMQLLHEYQIETQNLKKTLNEMQNRNKSLVEESQQIYHKDINNLRKQIQTLINENEDLSKMMIQIKNNFQLEIQKNQQLDKQVNFQEQDIKNKENQINLYIREMDAQKLKFDKLFQENSSYLKQQQNQFDIKLLQTQQNQKLHLDQIVQQNSKEVQSLNDKINVLIQKIDEQQNTILQLNYQNTIKSEEIADSRPEIQSLKSEILRLQKLTVDQTNEIDNWKLKMLKLEENFGLQQNESSSKQILLQNELEKLKQRNIQLNQDYLIKETKGNLDEALSNLSRLQSLLQETHTQLKQSEEKNSIQINELQELYQLKQTLSQIREKHYKEVENLKRAFETNIKVKIDKEISIEREKLDGYYQQVLIEKRGLENQLQSLSTENQLLKNEIHQQQEYFKLQVKDIIFDQQKQLLNVDHSYKLELKGLTEVQQAQFNAVILQYQNYINNIYVEKQALIIEIQSLQEQLQQIQSQKQAKIQQLDSKLFALKKDNDRLIDQKALERSRNTYLETQLKRVSTPVRDRRSTSSIR